VDRTPLRPPIFGGAEVELEEFGPMTPEARAALGRFLALPPEALAEATRHVYAYYRDVRAMIGDEGRLDAEMGVPHGPEAIWTHVQPRFLSLEQAHDDETTWSVSLEAECDWEVEHGLQVCWRDGTDVVKVGGFDGHVTNEDAQDDPGQAEVVYAAVSPEWVTRRAAS
jgi:hypothetical protein